MTTSTLEHETEASLLRPMLARPVKAIEKETDYAFEVKWDGIRALAYLDRDNFQLYSRNGRVITSAYPELLDLKKGIKDRAVILDGEIVVLDEKGISRFQLIQRRMGLSDISLDNPIVRKVPVTYAIFDLLSLNGQSMLECPYVFRREMLTQLKLSGRSWKTPPALNGHVKALFESAKQKGLEGLIAKRLDSPYEPGKRTDAWIKLKIRKRQEFIICGWQAGQGSRTNLPGAILLGYYDSPPSKKNTPKLVYAGQCGTGFTQKFLYELQLMLDERKLEASPFEINGPAPARGLYFSKPELIGEFEFGEWTEDNILRHSVFMGLRTDKAPQDIIREEQ